MDSLITRGRALRRHDYHQMASVGQADRALYAAKKAGRNRTVVDV